MISTDNLIWKKVESSQIAAVSFINKDQALYVKFKRGQIWQYSPFTFYEYGELQNAESIGKHFHSEIKNKKTGIKLSDGNRFKK